MPQKVTFNSSHGKVGLYLSRSSYSFGKQFLRTFALIVSAHPPVHATSRHASARALSNKMNK